MVYRRAEKYVLGVGIGLFLDALKGGFLYELKDDFQDKWKDVFQYNVVVERIFLSMPISFETKNS